MKKKYLVAIILNLFSVFNIYAFPKTGNCISFEKDGSYAIFKMDNGSAIQIKLCSQATLRIWFSDNGIFKRHNQSFAVVNDNIEDTSRINVDENSTCYEIFTSKLRLRINKSPFRLQVFDKYQKLLFSDYNDIGHIVENGIKSENKVLRTDEHFFGLGEKTGKLDRRGQAYKMWNSDKPCYSITEDPLYKSIPFFMSSYHYGIFVDNTYKTEFNFGKDNNDFYSFDCAGGEMVYYFMYGKNYKEIISEYVALTGKPIMPPVWSLGFSQCRGLLTNEKLTYQIANGYRKRGIPCDIIYQDIGWTDKLQNFEWRKENYISPVKMLSDLDSMGFKVIVSQDPVVSQSNTKQWNEADSKGYFVKDSKSGKSYDMPWPWGGNCGLVDFTKPEVGDWWGEYQQKAINDGVSGFWTDMGEPAWSNEEQVERLTMKHYLGNHDEIHNVYGLTWDKVVKEQFEKRNPDRRIFQMTRSAFSGMQRYTFGWTGDSGNGDDFLQGWNQMANQIPVLLSDGLGVNPFTTCDISGYCGNIDDYNAAAELYTRWVQMGAFNPLSRIHHEGDTAVEPWLFGKEAEKNVKSAIEMKYRLLPYLYTFAREAHDTGIPIMRAMFLEYPSDAETYNTDTQFMYGDELLVAPVVKKGDITRRLYLPEGKWIDYNNKQKELIGGQWVTVDAPLNVIPMFIKKGSIIPLMPVMKYIGEIKNYPLSIEIYPSEKGDKNKFSLYEDNGKDLGYQRNEYIKTPFCSTNSDKSLLIEIGNREGKGYNGEGNRDFVFEIYDDRYPHSISIDGVKKSKKQCNLSINKKDKSFSLRIKDDKKEHKIEITY